MVKIFPYKVQNYDQDVQDFIREIKINCQLLGKVTMEEHCNFDASWKTIF